jgi:hypothetical protein
MIQHASSPDAFGDSTRRNNLSFSKGGVYNTIPPFFRTVSKNLN